MPSTELTPKQALFVSEYLANGLEGKKAAISAGYSIKTADSQASQLLSNPKVAAEIAKRHGKRLGKLEITADKVLQELAKLAFFDIRKFYNADGTLKPIPELDDDTSAALVGMELEEAYEHFGKGQSKPNGILKKIKMADKGQNLERLGRHLKLFTDKVEVDATPAMSALIRSVRERKARYERGQS